MRMIICCQLIAELIYCIMQLFLMQISHHLILKVPCLTCFLAVLFFSIAKFAYVQNTPHFLNLAKKGIYKMVFCYLQFKGITIFSKSYLILEERIKLKTLEETLLLTTARFTAI